MIRSSIFPERGIRVSPGFALTLAALFLIGPRELAAAMLTAAALHECGHLALLAAFRVPVEGVRLNALGAVIHAPGAARLSYGRELAVTLAGPAVNLLFAPSIAALAHAASCARGYLFAGAHLALGLYNLLPILPLDGGRALYLSAAWSFGPTAGARAAFAAGLVCAAALTAGSAYWMLTGRGTLLFFASLGLLFGLLRQLWLAKGGAGV